MMNLVLGHVNLVDLLLHRGKVESDLDVADNAWT